MANTNLDNYHVKNPHKDIYHKFKDISLLIDVFVYTRPAEEISIGKFNCK
jgi:hypothetical protein